VEFDAPTFRIGRERWGTPRLRWCRQSAWILRWEFLALPRTPLPQDDSVLGCECGDSTTHLKVRPWFVAFLFSNFHLEQSRKTPRPRRLLLLPTGVPTTHSFGQSSCREFPSVSCRYRQTRGPSTAQDRPRADDLSPLGMTEYRETDADAHPSFAVVPAKCRDPSLGVLGFAKDSAASG
jgi:hypothetical protein